MACDQTLPPDTRRQACTRTSGDVTWQILDVSAERDWAVLDDEPVSAIVHAAAVTPPRVDPEPKRTIRVNLWGTVAGLEYVRRRTGIRYVLVSSAAVYSHGRTRSSHPLVEARAGTPTKAYALAKLQAEGSVTLYRKVYGVDACSVRLAGLYGPWERPTGARQQMSPIFQLTVAAVTRRPLRVSGLFVSRDWTYAEDIAAGLTHVAVTPVLARDVLNLSSGVPVTLGQVMEALRRLVPDAPLQASEALDADVTLGAGHERPPFDVRRIRRLGFVARTNLEAGLGAYVAWLRGEGRFVLSHEAGQ